MTHNYVINLFSVNHSAENRKCIEFLTSELYCSYNLYTSVHKHILTHLLNICIEFFSNTFPNIQLHTYISIHPSRYIHLFTFLPIYMSDSLQTARRIIFSPECAPPLGICSKDTEQQQSVVLAPSQPSRTFKSEGLSPITMLK